MRSLSLRSTPLLSKFGASATAMTRPIHVSRDDLERQKCESEIESYICHDLGTRFEYNIRYFLNGDKLNDLWWMRKWLKQICLYGAEKCATALIEKDSGINLDLNAVLDEQDGLPPLHLAAKSLKHGLTKVLLLYGADPNLPSFNNADTDNNAKLLPLELALEALTCNQYVRDWSAEKSFYKLFYIFCFLELEEPLKTIKFLALKTDKTEMICKQCVKGGELVKLAALLLMAWDKLRGPYADKGIEDWPIGQCILNEIRSLADQEVMLSASGSSNNLDPLQDCKTKMEAAWLMLKIFEACHDDLYTLRSSTAALNMDAHKIPFWVSSMLCVRNSIALRAEDVYSDDVKCLLPGLHPKEKALLDRALEKQMHSAYTRNKKNGAQRVSGARSLHTATSLSSSFYGDVKGLVATPTKVIKPSFVEFLPSARLCAQLLFAARTLK